MFVALISFDQATAYRPISMETYGWPELWTDLKDLWSLSGPRTHGLPLDFAEGARCRSLVIHRGAASGRYHIYDIYWIIKSILTGGWESKTTKTLFPLGIADPHIYQWMLLDIKKVPLILQHIMNPIVHTNSVIHCVFFKAVLVYYLFADGQGRGLWVPHNKRHWPHSAPSSEPHIRPTSIIQEKVSPPSFDIRYLRDFILYSNWINV